MRRLTPIALALALTITLAGCGSSGTHYSYQDVTVTIAPNVASIPVNATQQFTTTTTNAPNFPVWFATGATISPAGLFTAPATPPIYSQDTITAGAVQGTATVTAFVSNDPNNFLSDASATQSIIITAPSVTAGIAPATATVALGTTQQFTAYAVGNTNLAYTLQVGGVTGGNTSLGTITATGLYTAPATMPMTGSTVTITVISQADTTKSASASVTLH
jgi:hypothetical protein